MGDGGGRSSGYTLFEQLGARLAEVPLSAMRRASRLFKVQYTRFGAREAGQDEGGLYHDCISTLCDELNEGAGGLVPFLQPTPNEANALGRGGGGPRYPHPAIP